VNAPDRRRGLRRDPGPRPCSRPTRPPEAAPACGGAKTASARRAVTGMPRNALAVRRDECPRTRRPSPRDTIRASCHGGEAYKPLANCMQIPRSWPSAGPCRCLRLDPTAGRLRGGGGGAPSLYERGATGRGRRALVRSSPINLPASARWAGCTNPRAPRPANGAPRGNWGLLDPAGRALRWVAEHVAAFGGRPGARHARRPVQPGALRARSNLLHAGPPAPRPPLFARAPVSSSPRLVFD